MASTRAGRPAGNAQHVVHPDAQRPCRCASGQLHVGPTPERGEHRRLTPRSSGAPTAGPKPGLAPRGTTSPARACHLAVVARLARTLGRTLDKLQPGHYWKTPFYWEPGCPQPPAERSLAFEPVTDQELRLLIGAVMATSMDESDRFNVSTVGLAAAVQEVFDLLPQYFERQPGWWRLGKDAEGQQVGFLLPVTFKEERCWKEGKPQGTILYMGVLPAFRGRGYGLELVREATRVFSAAGCWRIFCDTGTDNAPMINAFRKAGYMECDPWERPLA